MEVIFYQNGKIKETNTNDYWKQGDDGVNVLNVKMWNDINSSYIDLTNYTVELVVERPDKQVSPRLLMATNASTGATINVNSWMTEICGNLKMNVILTDNSSHTKYTGIIYRMIGNSITPADQTITDAQYEAITEAIATKAATDDIEDGSIIAKKAKCDENGLNIKDTYAKIAALENGTLEPLNATNASNDSDGNEIKSFYTKHSQLLAGLVEPLISTKARQDEDGNEIAETYASKSGLENGYLIVKKTQQDEDGNSIKNTYSKNNATGRYLSSSLDPDSFVLTISLKDKDNNTLDSTSVDLPIESLVISASYDSGNKKLVLELKDGTEIEVDVSDLISGLVPENRTIAGIDLADNISKGELLSALELDNIVNSGDSDTPASGGTNKFTTGGAYNLKNEIYSDMASRAPNNHASALNTYGLGSTTAYGHVKIVNGDLSLVFNHTDGEAASTKHNHDKKYLVKPKTSQEDDICDIYVKTSPSIKYLKSFVESLDGQAVDSLGGDLCQLLMTNDNNYVYEALISLRIDDNKIYIDIDGEGGLQYSIPYDLIPMNYNDGYISVGALKITDETAFPVMSLEQGLLSTYNIISVSENYDGIEASFDLETTVIPSFEYNGINGDIAYIRNYQVNKPAISISYCGTFESESSDKGGFLTTVILDEIASITTINDLMRAYAAKYGSSAIMPAQGKYYSSYASKEYQLVGMYVSDSAYYNSEDNVELSILYMDDDDYTIQEGYIHIPNDITSFHKY